MLPAPNKQHQNPWSSQLQQVATELRILVGTYDLHNDAEALDEAASPSTSKSLPQRLGRETWVFALCQTEFTSRLWLVRFLPFRAHLNSMAQQILDRYQMPYTLHGCLEVSDFTRLSPWKSSSFFRGGPVFHESPSVYGSELRVLLHFFG